MSENEFVELLNELTDEELNFLLCAVKIIKEDTQNSTAEELYNLTINSLNEKEIIRNEM